MTVTFNFIWNTSTEYFPLHRLDFYFRRISSKPNRLSGFYLKASTYLILRSNKNFISVSNPKGPKGLSQGTRKLKALAVRDS